MKNKSLRLPWPPSVNNYWVRTRFGSLAVGKKGKAFRLDVKDIVGTHSFGSARLKVTILVNPPDKRKRDLDNLLKSTLDALEHAGLYDDDCQIDDLRIIRGDKEQGGALDVYLEVINGENV